MNRHAAILICFAIIPFAARAQQLTDAPAPASPEAAAVAPLPAVPNGYVRPTGVETMHDIEADTIGPYAVTINLFTAGLHQALNSPPEWGQGMAGYGKRFASNMGVSLTGNAIRYGLDTAMNVDTIYYRCTCDAFWPRVRHATLSAFVARQRGNGEPVFSYPNVVASYGSTMTAVYAWYPRGRYGVGSALRMGTFNLMGTMGNNLTFEFMPRKVHRYLRDHNLISSKYSDHPQPRP